MNATQYILYQITHAIRTYSVGPMLLYECYSVLSVPDYSYAISMCSVGPIVTPLV